FQVRLDAQGLQADLEPELVTRCIDEVGIGFLFAPRFHRAMKHAVGPRREVGIRTIFNLLGPLTNPAGAAVQVLGVYDRTMTEPLAHVLRELGTRSAMVVHGLDGLDELSLSAPTRVSQLHNGHVVTFEIAPEDVGLRRCSLEELEGGDADDNAAIIEAVLRGERGPRRDVVVLNAGAALTAAGAAPDLAAGIALAQESIDSGAAGRILAALREMAPRNP